MTTFYGVDSAPSSVGGYGDGGFRIRLGTWFYSAGGLNDGWACSGGRLFLASDQTGLIGTTVRFTAILRTVPTRPADTGSFSTDAGVVATADVVCAETGTWLEGSWTPFAFTDGQAVFIMYEWLPGANGHYSFQDGGERPGAAVESPYLPGLFLAEKDFARCYFNGDAGEGILGPSFNGAWYGSDIVVTTGTAPTEPNQGGSAVPWSADVAVVGGNHPHGNSAVPWSADLTASGHRAARGGTVVDTAWSVGAAGKTDRRGGAAVDTAWSVSVGGHAPAVDQNIGAAVVPYAYDVAAAGRTRHRGGVTLASSWGVGVSGQMPREAGAKVTAWLGADPQVARLGGDTVTARLEL